jgi:predicted Zn-dependent protease
MTAEGRRIDFAAARPSLMTIAFAVLWTAGWLVLLGITIAALVRFGTPGLVNVLVLVAGGPPVAVALLWAVTGKREALVITPSELRLYRWAGPIPLRRTIAASSIVGLHPGVPARPPLLDWMAVRRFYSGGCGLVVIETGVRTFSTGHTLRAQDAGRVLDEVLRFMPQLRTRVSAAAAPRRRTVDYLAGWMAVSMISLAVEVPVKLAIVDRPICFYDARTVPRQPIDVSGLRPSGRVVLVPIGGFPVERATALAEWVRAQFGVRIDVAPAMAWPDGAYSASRGQMNSAPALTRLESTYAAGRERVVAIGLTRDDIFNPGVNWSYVFSYRGDASAIVSPVRMDRGCMGVFQADDDRIMARLRKMVGKDIGILYFGLPMSEDPASMLYAHIGGPQELDAMSERF